MLAQTLVKINVVFFINVILVSQPEGLVSVDLLPFEYCFLDFFGLWLLFLFGLLYLQVFFSIGLFDFDWLFDFNLFLVVQVNWEINEL